MGVRTAWIRVALLACVLSTGCDDNADTADSETASTEAEAKKKKKEGRSYEDPETALTPAERADILMLCDALMDADRKRLSTKDEAAFFAALPAESDWGKLMVKHLKAEGRKKAGPRVARLLAQEDMRWASTRCRRVLAKYSRYQ
jgi:hypothetical protein